MKQYLSALFIIIIFQGFSQSKLPVVNANSTRAQIEEQGNVISNWTINPKIKQDIHITEKLINITTVKFKTDID